jgi:FKBP-type peptidyl-prolyl cis-trans isomerase SlyD
MTVGKDAVVTIAYTLKDDSGEVLDSSEGSEDLAYLHGHDNIVTGLEEALEGKSVGDSVSTAVSPEKGYGVRDDDLVFQISRDKLPDGKIDLGVQFAAHDKDGNEQIVTVVEMADESVTLDGNHPLASQTLHFDVTVNAIRKALKIELDHGHVHDPGHHHH